MKYLRDFNHFQNKNGGVEQFRVENGIDILGNLVESNVLSINRTEYGNLHNQGHNLISYIHDPENLYLVKNKIEIHL